MLYMQLWLVRHGENNRGADKPLTPVGEEQARLTGQRLEQVGINKIICSPLRRTIQTATFINESLGDLPIEIWPDIREGLSTHHFGPTANKILRDFPNLIMPEGFAAEPWEQGNDTYESLVQRGRSVVRAFNKRFKSDDNVLLVAHGGLINFLLHALLRIPARSPSWFELRFCCINRIELSAEKRSIGWELYPHVEAVVHLIGDVSHLPSNEQFGRPPENESGEDD